jgi:hypothetical protein
MAPPVPGVRRFHRCVCICPLPNRATNFFRAATVPLPGIEMRFGLSAIHMPYAWSVSRTCGWEFLPNVFPGRCQLCDLLDQSVRTPGVLVSDVARDGKYVSILHQSAAGRDAGSAVFGGFDHQTPTEIPLMIRLRMGKLCGAANVPMGNSEMNAPGRASVRRVWYVLWDKQFRRRCQKPRRRLRVRSAMPRRALAQRPKIQPAAAPCRGPGRK